MNPKIKQLETQRDALAAALRVLLELSDHVPVFQLDDGKASVKAVRLAGKFMGALKQARAALAALDKS